MVSLLISTLCLHLLSSDVEILAFTPNTITYHALRDARANTALSVGEVNNFSRRTNRRDPPFTVSNMASNPDDNEAVRSPNSISGVWSPQLRRIMGTLSGIGMLETAYLTYSKGSSAEPVFCSFSGSCADVLNGPYATVGDIPLAAFGFVALSLTLAILTWFGGAVENTNTRPIPQIGLSSAVTTVLASVAFFASVDTFGASANPDGQIMPEGGYPAPTITTVSSSRSITLAKNLKSLNAQMFGAYWCSHCYDQKETLGSEAMKIVPYVECAKEGKNGQSKLCKENNVPGYPTWSIGGKLYPGEQSVEELEDIVQQAAKTGKS